MKTMKPKIALAMYHLKDLYEDFGVRFLAQRRKQRQKWEKEHAPARIAAAEAKRQRRLERNRRGFGV